MNLLNQFVRRLALAVLPTWAVNRIRMIKNAKKPVRRLEIGPGQSPAPGYETLDLVPAPWVDYVLDAAGPLPFPDGLFQEVYASHILEHIPWYLVERVLREWVRILAPGGWLKIIVPDGLKLCHAVVQYELHGEDCSPLDGWYLFNPDRDPIVWAASRIFTFGDGTGNPNHPNWHRALFTPGYLRRLMEKIGLVNIQPMNPAEIHGFDHGWISLALKGQKPPCSESANGSLPPLSWPSRGQPGQR